MANITSFEILDKEISKTGGTPKVLEALWDGDTQGWFLVFSLYYETGTFFNKKMHVVSLGTLTLGDDIRLFDGQVLPWPEAVLAKELGEKAAKKHGLIFYFPSDTEPDDDCPAWTKRHLGIHCADCNKLIILSTSQYLPKDICSNCHSKREQVKKMKQNYQIKDAMFGLYQAANSEQKIRDYSLIYYLPELISNREPDKEINIIVFTSEELTMLRDAHYRDIKLQLAHYQKSDWEGEKRKFGLFEMTEFEGKEYELEVRFNSDHKITEALIRRYHTLEKAASEGWTYFLNIAKGITVRDDMFLRFIHYVSKDKATITSLNERYSNVLTPEEITATLNKLRQMGCITMLEDAMYITEHGKNIL
ncbi:hypothetical protein ACTHGU_20535 [Chitinophagaceae bacterium MMS25-I14]